MTTLHMKTEEVRNVAHRIDLAVGDLYLKPGRLKSAAGSIRSAWQGGKSAYYASQLQQMSNLLRDDVINLQRLVKRLHTEVDEWEDADHYEPSLGKLVGAVLGASAIGSAPWGKIKKYINNIDDFKGGISRLGVFSQVKTGASYKGQLIFSGPKALKNAAGLPNALTHVKGGNLWKSMLKNSQPKAGPLDWAIGFMEFSEKGQEDFTRYQDFNERASALKFDASFQIAKFAVSHKVAAAATGAAVGAVSAALAGSALVASAPVWVPTVVIGGTAVATWWAVSSLTGTVMEGAYATAQTIGVKDAIVKADALQTKTSIETGKRLTKWVDGAFRAARMQLLPAP